MQDSVEGLAEVQEDDIICSSVIHQRYNPVIEDHQICQAQFAFSEAMLPVTNHILIFHMS